MVCFSVELFTPAAKPAHSQVHPHTSTPSVPSRTVTRLTHFAQSQGSISAIDQPPSCIEATPRHHQFGAIELKSLSMDLEDASTKQASVQEARKEVQFRVNGPRLPRDGTWQPRALMLQGSITENDCEDNTDSLSYV